MTPEPITLRDKLGQFSERWSPKVIARLNDYELKLVKLQGEFVWHRHDDTDEMFLCLHGEMDIAFRDGTVHLGEGEVIVVPKGIEHRPSAAQECHVLIIEPEGVVNTGDTDSELRAQNDQWI
ncbi:MAG: cupin domain-containing protein [Woeseiaceae bacterium]